MNTTESLLKAILSMVARSAVPPSEVVKIVAPTANQKKQIAAYNMCDGSTSQAEISKKLKIDRGGLSHSISRWIEAGVVVRVGQEQYPMHIYPLAKTIRGSK